MMALIMDFQTQYDTVITGCYWKIDADNGMHGGKKKLRVKMSCYKDKASADTNTKKYSDINFEFVPNVTDTAANFIKQAYAFAKTLPEFKGAVDA